MDTDSIEWIDPNDLLEHEFSGNVYGNDVIDDLVASIRTHGVLVPLVVTGNKVISGNRRLRAARDAGLKRVPCIRRIYAGELEEHEAILEHNRYRLKTGLQLFREGKAFEEIERVRARERQVQGGKEKVVQHVAQPVMGRKTRSRIAKAIGLGSGEQWRRLEYVASHDTSLLSRIGKQGISIGKAYAKVRNASPNREQAFPHMTVAADRELERPILRHGSFAELSHEISDQSVSLLITSIRCDYGPWPDRLELWKKVAQEASRFLVKGGFVIGYAEKVHFQEIMRVLLERLDYFWIAACVLPNWTYDCKHASAQRAVTNWRPIIICSRGRVAPGEEWRDTLVASKEETANPLEALSIARYLVRTFSTPNGLVLDPCAGIGNLLLSALLEKRRALGYESNPLRYQAAVSRLARAVTTTNVTCPRSGCKGRLLAEGEDVYCLSCGYRASASSQVPGSLGLV